MPIFDQGYQHWSGQLSGHAWRWLAITRHGVRIGMQSRTIMEWALRIMANLLRPDELGPAEAAYGTLAQLVRLAPEP